MHALSPAVYAALVGAGLAGIFRRSNRHRVAILAYHGLHAGECDAVDNFDGLLLHVDHFEQQMRYLRRHDHVVPLDGSLARHGPPHRVVVTFDDGYASVYRLAFPILRALALPATVFVPTDFITGRQTLWWDRLRTAIRWHPGPRLHVTVSGTTQALPTASPADKLATLRALHERLAALDDEERARALDSLAGTARPDPLRAPLTVGQMREMGAAGIAFQSHGTSHRAFGTLSPEEVWREAYQSRRLIEAWVGREVRWLAYPFGDPGHDAENVVARAGYRGTLTMREGLARADERFCLPRIAIGDPVTPSQFAAAVSGLRAAVGPKLRWLAGRRRAAARPEPGGRGLR